MPESSNKRHFDIGYVFVAMALILLFQYWFQQHQQVEVIPYSQFEELLGQHQVKRVVIRDDVLEGELKSPLASGKTWFLTTRVDAELAGKLTAQHVEFSRTIDSKFWPTLLSWVVPVLFFFLLWQFMFRRMGMGMGGQAGGLMSIGRSKAKVYVETDTKVTFADVAGVDEATAELQEVVNFLKDPQGYGRLGARAPKGILLVGPPGTGKTLLARAVAGEAGVSFFSINGSEFVEMFVGVGAARVRDLFERAAQTAPCIIFIDELDALGKARTLGGYGGHDEKEQTLNQLLVELDGFDPSSGIVLLAATNRPEILDPALLRAGRFDRQVLVDRPDRPGRVAILHVHLKKVQLDTDVDADQIAALTPGFTGADLANLVNEAALLATRRSASAVSMGDFTEAIERIVAGLEKKNRILNPHERHVVAYHEMGHALVALSLPGMDPVHKISIIPRGIGALGYTMQRPTEDRFLMTRHELENKLAVLLGGRAAEVLIFDELSTGAGDDLQKATAIATEMATRYGMIKTLGNRTYDSTNVNFLGDTSQRSHEYSEQTNREIDLVVRELVDRAFARATDILVRHKPLLEEYSQKLLQAETLTRDELPHIELEADGPSSSAT